MATLGPYVFNEVYNQQQQAAMYQPGSSIPYSQRFLTGITGTTTAANSGWDMATSLTTTGGAYIGGTVLQDWAQKAYQKMITFFRVNQPVTMPEGGTIEEPLDELRIKVMRWLDGCKVKV